MAHNIPAYEGKIVSVMGLGRSGLSSVKTLLNSGAIVYCWDDKEELRQKAADLGAIIHDLQDDKLWDKLEFCVWSPGIPHHLPTLHPVATLADKHHVALISDITLLKQACPKATFVGITGTNGKSTTTSLIGHILQENGLDVEIGGNLGIPALDLKPLSENGIYILEMSSYQIELTKPLPFDVAALLNITPDHLERHGGMDGYITAKLGLFDQQDQNHTAVIAIDDEITQGIAASLGNKKAALLPVTCQNNAETAIYVSGNKLMDALGEQTIEAMDLSIATTLPGAHNHQNIVVSYAICRRLGLETKTICDAICTYPGLPHRQQMIAIFDNVAFVNDSKATNAEASAKALSCYPAIYWIAGGKEKEGGYDILTPYLKNLKRAYFIGEAAENLTSIFKEKISCKNTGDMDQAIFSAFEDARMDKEKGAVILLSPACASFDQYNSFEHRGDVFMKTVFSLSAANKQILLPKEIVSALNQKGAT